MSLKSLDLSIDKDLANSKLGGYYPRYGSPVVNTLPLQLPTRAPYCMVRKSTIPQPFHFTGARTQLSESHAQPSI